LNQEKQHDHGRSDSEFKYVEYAFGSVANRNKVESIEWVLSNIPPNNPRECYHSLYRFDNSVKDHLKQHGKMSHVDQLPVDIPYVPFDIDSKNLDDALNDCRFLIDYLEQTWEISPKNLRVYFSGSKGFHLYVPKQLFGWQPSPQLPLIIRGIAKKLIDENIETDMSIYNHNRLWRIENTINRKKGLYKIPIRMSEFQHNLTIEEIEEKAKNPVVDDFSIDPTELEPMSELMAMYERERGNLRKKPAFKHSDDAPSVNLPCIRKLLEGVGKGNRNEVAYRLASYYRKEAISQAATLIELSQWNSKNSPSMNDEELERTVSSAYSSKSKYGCNDPILSKYCDDSCPVKKKRQKSKTKTERVSFVKLPSGGIAEMCLDRDKSPSTFFAVYEYGKLDYCDSIDNYSPFVLNEFLKTRALLLPSAAEDYGSEQELLEDISDFIGKYLIVSPFYHKLATHYVRFSWVHDRFENVLYLRAIGDFDSGKSRFLQTIGALCYKPFFASGAASTSAIFRCIDLFGGTLIIDEGDLTNNDEHGRLVKILNQGYMKGCPVIINEPTKNNDYMPRPYNVYGPKLISTRSEFKDKALESRCLTENMNGLFKQSDSKNIPYNLDSVFWARAQVIRNKLLMYRLKKYGCVKINPNHAMDDISSRLNQIVIPFCSIIEDGDFIQDFKENIRLYNAKITENRRNSYEGTILTAIGLLYNRSTERGELVLKDIAEEVDHLWDLWDVTPRGIGHYVGNVFNLEKSSKNYGTVIPLHPKNCGQLNTLFEKYGVECFIPLEQPSQPSQPSLGESINA
jgi:Primase C terminal 1 (PriCT-1)